MKRLAVIVLLVTGCVSVSEQQVSPHALENAQAKWLRGLERGQPLQDITLAVAPGAQYSIEILDHGQIYQYISGEYPITETLYGRYFAAGRLEAPILDQDVIVLC